MGDGEVPEGAGTPEMPASVADALESAEFATVRKGYDPEQVRAHLAELAATIREQDEGLDDFDRLGSAITDLFRKAEQSAKSMQAEAEELAAAEADETRAQAIKAAEAEASAIVQQASEQGEKMKAEAEKEAGSERARAAEETAAMQAAQREHDATVTQEREQLAAANDDLEKARAATEQELTRSRGALEDERRRLEEAARRVIKEMAALASGAGATIDLRDGHDHRGAAEDRGDTTGDGAEDAPAPSDSTP